MKLAIIYPGMFGGRNASDAMQPLAVAALAAATPDDWDIEFHDDRIESFAENLTADLVAMPVLTYTAKRAYAIAEGFRSRGIPVALGGFHPTLLPDEASLHCDCVVTGDAENVWRRVIRDFSAGSLQPRYDGGICSCPESIRFDRSVFNGKKYAAMIPLQLTRGCRYSCDFCSIHAFYGRNMLVRPRGQVLEEVGGIKNRFLFLTDDNLLSDRETLLPFLGALGQFRKNWSCQISIDAAYQPDLLKAMRRAGCLVVFVGFESMNAENLKSMGKGENFRRRDYAEAVARFRDAGLLVCGSFVFGYDHDTEGDIWQALEFGMKEQLTLCHFNPLYPYPRTRVYDRLQAEGRLLYEKWWLDDGFRYGEPMFRPRRMSPEALTETCFAARREFNRLGSIASRALNRKNNARTPFALGTFLASNFISRREIYQKQGAYLG